MSAEDDEYNMLHIDFVDGLAVVVPRSTHGWIVGSIGGRSVAITHDRTPQRDEQPSPARIAAAMAFARAQP